MSTLILRGATIEKTESYCSSAGQCTTEIHFEAAWSEPVCEQLHWTKEPEGFGNGSLDGQLAGISMIVEPNGKDLKDYRYEISIDTVGKFKHKASVKDNEVVDRSLTFIVTTTAEDAHLVLDKWLRMVGPSDSKAQVKVQYNAKQQMELPAAEAEETPIDKPRGRKRNIAEAGAVQ